MAGAGYKLFATGDVLTAAQVNTYLMQQTVMVFASSAARTTALSGVLAEGMVSYLQDTNTLEVYDGSAWVGATGDITGLTAGTGISITSATGPVPTVAIDTAVTADLSTAQTLTNKTLTSPVLTTPSISNIDAKGDILVGTADNTLGVLTAGSNGETLVADSSATTGLRWQPHIEAGKNFVINGGFDVWQRGTSFSLAASTSAANGFTADRWQTVTGANQACTITRQATGDTTNLPNIQYCLRYQRNSGQTGTSGALTLTQSFETVNSIPLAGRTVTFSFYARAGANFSAASSALNVYLISGTGTDQNRAYGATYTGEAYPINNQTATLTTTWQRFSFSGTVAATATELCTYLAYVPVGTAGAADYYEVTGIQLEVGSVPTAFSRTGGTIAGELAACQRYYQKSNNQSEAPGAAPTSTPINAINASTTLVVGVPPFKVSMRVAPTVTLYSSVTGTTGRIRSGGADVVASAADVGEYAIGYISATGLTAGSNSTIAFAASSEL